MGGKAWQDRAKGTVGQVHYKLFSTSHFTPSVLSLDWILLFWSAMIKVILQWSEWYCDDQSDIAMIRVIMRWSEWYWDGHSQTCLGSDDFSLLTNNTNRHFIIIYINHHHLYHIAQRLKLTLSNTISVSEGLTSPPPHSHPATNGDEEDFLLWDLVWEEKWKLCKLILRFFLQIQGRSEAGWVGNMKVFLVTTALLCHLPTTVV